MQKLPKSSAATWSALKMPLRSSKFTYLKDLAEDLGDVLLPIRDSCSPMKIATLYDGKINAFNNAITYLEKESVINAARQGLGVRIVRPFVKGVFWFLFSAKGLGEIVRYNC
jgi:hypothetical protein